MIFHRTGAALLSLGLITAALVTGPAADPAAAGVSQASRRALPRTGPSVTAGALDSAEVRHHKKKHKHRKRRRGPAKPTSAGQSAGRGSLPGSGTASGAASSGAGAGGSGLGGSNGTQPSLYWGALVGTQFTGDQEPWDMTSVSILASMVGKGLSVVHFATPFADCEPGGCSGEPFPTTPLNNIRNYGAIPFLDFESMATQNNSSISSQLPDTLSAVIDGYWNGYLKAFAQKAKAWGHPFFLRFDWEMNANWFPWSEGVNGNTAGQYVAAWRHVHDIFTQAGASNVSWVWCPNVDPAGGYTPMQELYPGSAYVDWTCLDGYNEGTNPISAPGDQWQTFDQLYRSTYNQIVNTIAPDKPMILGEVGSTEIGGSKAQWISQMLNELPTAYPAIHGLIWYDRSSDGWDWPIESSASSLAAFSSGITNPAYAANHYSNLSSPIALP